MKEMKETNSKLLWAIIHGHHVPVRVLFPFAFKCMYLFILSYLQCNLLHPKGNIKMKNLRVHTCVLLVEMQVHK